MRYELTIGFTRPLRQVFPIEKAAVATSVEQSTGSATPVDQLQVELEQQRKREEERRREEERQKTERQQIASVLASLMASTQALQAEYQKRWIEMERAAVELAVAVASRLLHTKIEAGDFAVEALVRSIVSHLEGQQPTDVYLHPDDLALLRRRVHDEQTWSPDNRKLRVSADPSLRRGHCRAQAGDISILSQFEVQLADLHQHLQRSVLHEQANTGKAKA